MNSIQNLAELQAKIGYTFNDESLLIQALTHTSYANEKGLKYTDSYEQLEYLGDTVLQLITSEYLLKQFPDAKEGTLTQYRASLVSEKALSKRAKEIGLNHYIMLGNGERKTDGANKPSILCDVMESLIGAIYKDTGLRSAESFIYKFVLKDVTIIDTDYKSQLQIKLSTKADKLEYKLVSTSGTDHEPLFTIQAVVDGKTLGTGQARTKKEAEQMASREALEKMK